MDNIKQIISANVNSVDVNAIELPDSMQEHIEQNTTANDANNGVNSGENEQHTMSMAELSQMILIGYNAVSCAFYKRIEPTFDASLTQQEFQALETPLNAVLNDYNIAVTPMQALIIALVGVNAGKLMQLKFYRMQLAQQAAEQQKKESEVKNEQFI